jgi:hypothetical protein
MILYYLHERGWSHVKWGLVRANASRTQPVTETGIPAPVVAASSFTDSQWAANHRREETPALARAVAGGRQ